MRQDSPCQSVNDFQCLHMCCSRKDQPFSTNKGSHKVIQLWIFGELL